MALQWWWAALLLPLAGGQPQDSPLGSAVNFPGGVGGVGAQARTFVEDAEMQLETDAIKATFASWNYESNITEANQAVSLAAQEVSGLLIKKLGKEAQKFDLAQVGDEDVKRKLKLMKNLGTSVLPDAELKRFNKLVSDMGSTYSKAKVSKQCTSVRCAGALWNVPIGHLIILTNLFILIDGSSDSSALQ
jgi:hypothetical protein